MKKNNKIDKQQMQRDYEKYNVASIWQVFTTFIALLFLRNYIDSKYLINFSVDVAIAIVATIVAVRSFQLKYRVVKQYQLDKKYVYIDILSVILCIAIKISVPTNFDVTFLILVLSYLLMIRMTKKQFEQKLGAMK